MIMKEKENKKTKELNINFGFFVRALRKDTFMVTLIIISLLVCVYCAYYSTGYDKRIQEHYITYIQENCKDMNGIPIFTRPAPFTPEGIMGKVMINNSFQIT